MSSSLKKHSTSIKIKKADITFNASKPKVGIYKVGVALCPLLAVLFFFLPNKTSSEVENSLVHTVTSNAVLIILTALVIVSLTFEGIQHVLEHAIDPVFKPVLNALNQELMGIGFLAIIFYFIAKFKVLIDIAKATVCEACDPCKGHIGVSHTNVTCNTNATRRLLFETPEQHHIRAWGGQENWDAHRQLGVTYTGECEKLECDQILLHMFEDIHMTLFLVLVCFFLRAVLLLKQVGWCAEKWRSYETKLTQPVQGNTASPEETVIKNYHQIHASATSGPSLRKDATDELEFMLLRKRFLQAGKSGGGDAKNLDSDFSFAEYMNIAISHVATEVVEIPPIEWAAMEIFFLFCFGALHAEPWRRPRLYFAYTLCLFVFMLQLNGKLKWILKQCTIPYPEGSSGSKINPETDWLGSKPGYLTDPTLKDKIKKASSKKSGGHGGHGHGHGGHSHKANVQDALFWRNNPEQFLHFVRFCLLVMLIYFVMLVWILPFSWKKEAKWMLWVLLPLPFMCIAIVYVPMELIRRFSLATHVELLKNPKYIEQVQRAVKLKKSKRAIKLLRSLKSNVAMQSVHGVTDISEADDDEDATQRKEQLRETFDLFDLDKSGSVDINELGAMMKSMGVFLEEAEKKQLMKEFDADNSNSIGFDEFYLYMKRRSAPVDPKDLVKQIFAEIDQDGSGEVTAQEFKTIMEGQGSGLSDRDIDDLIKEIDTSGDGSIGLDEFAEILEKYS